MQNGLQLVALQAARWCPPACCCCCLHRKSSHSFLRWEEAHPAAAAAAALPYLQVHALPAAAFPPVQPLALA
eukprot:scaffold146824_cov12-Tisochrysis_lutea.AAC.1